MKQQKLLSVVHGGTRFECFQTENKNNPYTVKLVWYDRGWHRRIIAKYANFSSVLAFLLDFENARLGWADPETKVKFAKEIASK